MEERGEGWVTCYGYDSGICVGRLKTMLRLCARVIGYSMLYLPEVAKRRVYH